MTTVRRREEQANGVRSQSSGMASSHSAGSSEPTGRLDDFRPSLTDQLGDSIERVFQVYGWRKFAERVDRKKSRVHEWVGDPGQIPAYAIEVLVDMDPDPEFPARLAGILASRMAARALAREASGRTRIIIEDIGPGRVGRRS